LIIDKVIKIIILNILTKVQEHFIRPKGSCVYICVYSCVFINIYIK